MQCAEYCGVHACTLYSLSFIILKMVRKEEMRTRNCVAIFSS